MKKGNATLRAAALALAVGLAAGYGLRGLAPAPRPEAGPSVEMPSAAPAAGERPRARAEQPLETPDQSIEGKMLVVRERQPWTMPPQPEGLKAGAAEFSGPSKCEGSAKWVTIGNEWEGHATRPVLTNKSSRTLRDIRASIDLNGESKTWTFPVILPGQTVKGEGLLKSPEHDYLVISFAVREGARGYTPLAKGTTPDPCSADPSAGFFRLGR